jgi:hypothetical protein
MPVAAFTLGLMHSIYHMTRDFQLPVKGRPEQVRHLMYVETEKGIWEEVYHQLASLFTTCDPPVLTMRNSATMLEKYTQLGPLPLFLRIPLFAATKFHRVASDSPVGIMGLVTGRVATVSVDQCTYLVPCADMPATPILLPQEIDDIRNALPAFLIDYTTNVTFDSAYRSGELPCLAAYRRACELLEVPASSLPGRIARSHYPGLAMVGMDAFFDLVYTNLRDADRHTALRVVRGAPADGTPFNAKGQHIFVSDDFVIVSHAIVEIINAEYPPSWFDRKQLTEEFIANKLLIDAPMKLETNRCWVFSRKTWDDKVIRPAIEFAGPITPGMIHLSNIA